MECKCTTGSREERTKANNPPGSFNRGKISYQKQEDCLFMTGESRANSSATCFPIDWNQLPNLKAI